jgi:L-alanine-DL-glutamate epimerase-like enolase superfamily enzyme
MKITGVETRLYRIPPTVHVEDSIQRISHWEWIVSRVTTDARVVGVGFAYTLGIGGSAVRELVDGYLAPFVVGEDPQDVRRIWHRLAAELHALGAGGMTTLALACLDVALWDILGKQANLPLWRLLGGHRERIPAYGSGINMHLDGEPLLDQMRGFLERGYRAVKMKVGREDPAEDVERVAAVRRLVGPSVRLLLDANQKWTAGEAIRRAAMLRPFDPFWLEEPILADDLAGHAHARRAIGIPLAVGETLYTRHQFAEWMAAGAVDVVQADVPRVGGFTPWLAIAETADGFNLPVAPHFVMELSLQALCAVTNGLILEDLQGGSLTDLGVLAEPIRVERGEGRPPARPGHGVLFDDRALARYEVAGRPTGVAPTRTGG